MAMAPGGMAVTFAIDVRKADGTLFYHEATIKAPVLPPPPEFPSCPASVDRYKHDLDYWVAWCKSKADYYRLLHDYHSARCEYCMRHRNDDIDEKYQKGEPVPLTIEEAKSEIKKLRR